MKRDTVHTTEVDSVYMSGIECLKALDYKKAVTILRPYDDYNTALAFMSADYNHSALDVLGRLDDTDPKVCYLKAMVLSRLEQHDEALKYFELCLAYDPYMRHRANLDPELFEIIKLNNLKSKVYEINEIAAQFYHENLYKPTSKIAQDYVKKRKMDKEELEKNPGIIYKDVPGSDMKFALEIGLNVKYICKGNL